MSFTTRYGWYIVIVIVIVTGCHWFTSFIFVLITPVVIIIANYYDNWWCSVTAEVYPGISRWKTNIQMSKRTIWTGSGLGAVVFESDSVVQLRLMMDRGMGQFWQQIRMALGELSNI